MPRPKRPTPNPLRDHIVTDEWLTETTGLERSGLPRLKRATEDAFTEYYSGWKPGTHPGRRPENHRDDLIVTVARIFQRHSGWNDEAFYLDYLIEFLRVQFAAHDVRLPQSRLRRIIPPALRIPRGTTKEHRKK